MQRDGGPGGAGGAGNPTGGAFTGPAEALEIVGNHAYAFSGVTAATSALVTRLKFTSGNYYFVGRITCNGSVDVTGLGNGNVTGWVLSYNGVEVARILTDTAAAYVTANANYNEIIIPPYTNVEVTSVSDGNDATRQTSCGLTGRIYRG